MFIWIKDVVSIISVRMTVKIIKEQELWKQDAIAVGSGAEESPAQQRTNACLSRWVQNFQGTGRSQMSHVVGGLCFRVSKAVLRANIVRWTTGFQ